MNGKNSDELYSVEITWFADVDECLKGECQGRDQICINTLGSFKCHVIRCPPNYVHDKNYKKYGTCQIFKLNF